MRLTYMEDKILQNLKTYSVVMGAQLGFIVALSVAFMLIPSISSAETVQVQTETTPVSNVVPKAKVQNSVQIAIDGVPLTSVNVDLSNTDTDLTVSEVSKKSEPKIVSLWKGLWTRISTWLRI